MVKRMLLVAAVAVSGFMVSTPKAEAGIVFGRVAPVRRAARVALPPYPVARRAVVGPVFTPVVRPAFRPVIIGTPMFYGPGVSVGVY